MKSLKTDKAILCLGDINPDIIIPYGESRQIMDAIARGEEVDNTYRPDPTIQSGGATANTASGLARLGMPVYFAGKAGKDYYSDFLKEDFHKDGVMTDYMACDPAISTVAVFAVVSEDKNRILYAFPPVHPSHLQLVPEDLPDELMDKIGWVQTTGFMLRENPAADTVIGFLEKCKAHGGITISFDLNLRIEVSPFTDEFKARVNRCVELADVLLGSGKEEYVPLSGKATPEEACKYYADQGKVVICRAGAAGVEYYQGNEHGFLPTFDVEVVDTVGAGDAFNAGFIASVARGLDLHDAVMHGNAAACYAIGKVGARTVPSWDVVEEFIEKTPLIGQK